MEATPRPWFIQERNDQHPYIVATTGDRYGVNIVYGNPTGGGAYFIGHEDVCRANAELIVRAVNAHDRLVEALEWALNGIDAALVDVRATRRRGSLDPGLEAAEYNLTHLMNDVDAALALARGEVE